MLYGTTYMQNLKEETNDFIETDNTMVVARAWGEETKYNTLSVRKLIISEDLMFIS